MSWSKKYRHAEHAHTVTEHGSSAAGQEHGAHHSHEHVHGANQEQSYSPMHTHHHGEGHAPMTEPLTEPLLELRNLEKRFGQVQAVDQVSLSIREGECLGLYRRERQRKVYYRVSGRRPSSPRRGEVIYRGGHLQMVFQNPRSSMDPRRKVLDDICEGMWYHRHGLSKEEIRKRALEMMDMVQLSRSYADRYTRELSGGECQRAAIARAILVKPRLLICDEVTSALDVSVQAQIIRLLDQLKRELGLSFLFISHDIALVSSFCDRVAVMYQGKIVEEGTAMEVIQTPREAYTRRLIDSVLTL